MTTTERELHPSRFITDPSMWWACEFPERQPTKLTWFDEECRACMLACAALVMNGGNGWTSIYSSDGETRSEGITHAEAYEMHRHRHGLPPLP